MTLQLFIFYIFAIVTVISAVMVVVSRNPVQGALYLVLTFVAAAGVWMLMQAEFLSLILILVYVGAVMTLFLFVVMMMNLDRLPTREAFKKYLPLAVVIAIILIALVVLAISPQHLTLATAAAVQHPPGYSNVATLGNVLYTNYVYAFELASVILLAAIIAAISLAFRGKKPITKQQRAEKQIATRREDSVKLVKMKSRSTKEEGN